MQGPPGDRGVNFRAVARVLDAAKAAEDIRGGRKVTSAAAEESYEALEKYGPISDWDVSQVTDMYSLFRDFKKFNDDISKWDTSGVTDMALMFDTAIAA